MMLHPVRYSIMPLSPFSPARWETASCAGVVPEMQEHLLAYRQAQKGAAKGKAKVEQPDSDSGSDDLETKYERTPRQRVPDKQDTQKAVLPTKSLHGELVYAKDKADNSVPRLQVSHASMVVCTLT